MSRDQPRRRINAAVWWTAVGILSAAVAAFSFVLLGAWARQSVQDLLYQGQLNRVRSALRAYRETFGCYPPAYTTDAKGTPLSSWRLLITPYCELQDVYDQYDFLEPWDGLHNRRFAQIADQPEGRPFSAAGVRGDGDLRAEILAVVHAGGIWRPGERVKDDAVAGDPVIVALPSSTIHWMEPKDAADLDKTQTGQWLTLNSHRKIFFSSVTQQVDWIPASQVSGILWPVAAEARPQDEHPAPDIAPLIRHLITRLTDDEWRVRHQACIILGELTPRPSAALPAVRERLNDEDRRVRLMAQIVLRKLQNK